MRKQSLITQFIMQLVVLFTLESLPASAERIRDLVTVQGVRDNALIGYGLVVGLDGSGDQTMQTPFTTQSLSNMLSQLGITVPPGTNMQLKNVAAVMVTAKLPAFSRAGQTIDVVVSSMGNAKSIRGGTLLMTPLKGVDNQVYALAEPKPRWRLMASLTCCAVVKSSVFNCRFITPSVPKVVGSSRSIVAPLLMRPPVNWLT